MTTRTRARYEAGWHRNDDGRVYAFMVDPTNPRDSIIIECRNWWCATLIAMEMALAPDCVFIGGPER